MSEYQRIGVVAALFSMALLGCQAESVDDSDGPSAGPVDSPEAALLLDDYRQVFEVLPIESEFSRQATALGLTGQPGVFNPLGGSTGATLVEADGYFSASFAGRSERDMALLIPRSSTEVSSWRILRVSPSNPRCSAWTR